jgi:small-conductance mechanosensitive channel
VRPAWRPKHYWDVYFETLERSKIALDVAGIEISYPHRVEIQKEGQLITTYSYMINGDILAIRI